MGPPAASTCPRCIRNHVASPEAPEFRAGIALGTGPVDGQEDDRKAFCACIMESLRITDRHDLHIRLARSS